jgi:hypothetical protein
MLVTIPFRNDFNPRRYGRPWVAKLTFDGAKPVYDFDGGRWDGEALVVEAEVGDVLAYGQKDMRGHNGFKEFATVEVGGEVCKVSEGVARDHFHWRVANAKRPLGGFTAEDLLAELRHRGLKVRVGS